MRSWLRLLMLLLMSPSLSLLLPFRELLLSGGCQQLLAQLQCTHARHLPRRSAAAPHSCRLATRFAVVIG